MQERRSELSTISARIALLITYFSVVHPQGLEP